MSSGGKLISNVNPSKPAKGKVLDGIEEMSNESKSEKERSPVQQDRPREKSPLDEGFDDENQNPSRRDQAISSDGEVNWSLLGGYRRPSQLVVHRQ